MIACLFCMWWGLKNVYADRRLFIVESRACHLLGHVWGFVIEEWDSRVNRSQEFVGHRRREQWINIRGWLWWVICFACYLSIVLSIYWHWAELLDALSWLVLFWQLAFLLNRILFDFFQKAIISAKGIKMPFFRGWFFNNDIGFLFDKCPIWSVHCKVIVVEFSARFFFTFLIYPRSDKLQCL